jgi:hypothetical protein
MYETDFQLELSAIVAESIGWISLESGAYLHVSDENTTEVLVVGLPQVGEAVLLVGGCRNCQNRVCKMNR